MKSKIKKIDIESFQTDSNISLIKGKKKLPDTINSTDRCFRELVDLLPQIVFELDKNGIIIYINNMAVEILGYPIDEIMGVCIVDFVKEDEKERSRRGIANTVHGSKYAGISYTIKKKDGSLVPFLVYANQMHYDGNITGVRGIAVDVSSVHQVEKALKESEELFKIIAEQTVAGIFVVQEDKVVFLNNSFAEISGYSAQVMMNWDKNDFIKHIHCEDRKEVAEYFTHQGQNPNDVLKNIQYCINSGNGKTKWIELWSKIVKFRGKNSVFSIGIDITGRKETEKVIRDSEEKFRSMIENSFEVICIFGIDGKIKYTSQSLFRMLGYGPEEVLNACVFDLAHPEDRSRLLDVFSDAMKGILHKVYLEFRCVHKDGSYRYIATTASNLLEHPAVKGIVINLRDITERKLAEESFRQSEKKFRTMIEHSSEVITIIDKNEIVQYESPSITKVFGYSPEELIGTNVFELIHEDDLLRLKKNVQKQISEHTKHVVFECHHKHKDGRWIDVELTATNMLDDPIIKGVVANIKEITEAKKAEIVLRESEEKFRTMIEHSSEVIIIINTHGIISCESQSVYHLFGYTPEEINGLNFFELVHEDDRSKITRKLSEGIEKSQKYIVVDCRVRHKDGNWRDIDATISNMISNSAIKGVIVNVRDITDRKIAEEKATYYEFYDSLTNLPNRDMLLSRLDGEIRKAQISQRKNEKEEDILAVMCLGLDNFKKVNEMYGPIVGDQLLYKVGLKLHKNFRDVDLVARYIGDTFMILFSDISSNDDVIELIQKTINIFSDPFIVENNVLRITSSIGVSLYPHDGHKKEQLIKNSESAMYMAKEQGRNTYRLFDAQMNSAILTRLKLEHELENAIYHNHFKAYFQPKVDRYGNITGMESLIRWDAPNNDHIILPEFFIPVAEKTGMIIDIGNIILYQSCFQNRKWQDMGLPPIRVAVNISPAQFKQPNLISSIKNIINRTGLDPQYLELEITESGIMEDEKENIIKLNQLHEMGIKISIDDFGIGYSSLSKLKDYPIDTLKIDKSFVENLPDDEKSAAITTTIIDLAHNLGFKVVAEGVETKKQLDFLCEHSCDQFQGYLFYKPLTQDQFEEELKKIFPV